MDKILLCLAHMSGNEMKYVEEAFADNWVVPLGPNVNAFEADLKSFIESAPDSTMTLSEGITTWPKAKWASSCPKEIVALSSGTAAVHLGLIAAGIKPGDEVICQSFTFCASCNPVSYLGAVPILVDSEPQTWNIDPLLLEQAIIDRISKTGKAPKAIIPVYLYGMPPKMDELLAIAHKYGIPVIEDAAEGLGSRYKGRVAGSLGEFGVLSFNGNKMITTSGGGALICPNKEKRDEAMFYATQARESYPYYQHEKIGYNYRMSNICAGIGRGQMTILERHISHHKMLAAKYKALFADVPGIEYHAAPVKVSSIDGSDIDTYDSNYWLSTITLDPDLHVKGQEFAYNSRISEAIGGAGGVTHKASDVHTQTEPNANVEALRLALAALGIESRPLWKPMHLQPIYKSSPVYDNGVSEELFKTGLCLPSGPWVTEDNVSFIVDTIKNSIS